MATGGSDSGRAEVPGPRLRVMLVDDDSSVRLLERRLLEMEGGFDICAECADGRMAIALAERVQPGAVILDLSMPDMTGLEALGSLRQRLPDSLIVLCTGSTRMMNQTRVPEGADAYLEKTSKDWTTDVVSVLVDFAERTPQRWPIWERRVAEPGPDLASYEGPERRRRSRRT
ncbi:MAG TPA: response regulator transcription factor [Acidimicrobiales bacterium]|nr:response regulator transcription factor [Acidimicrobiales bacterium]